MFCELCLPRIRPTHLTLWFARSITSASPASINLVDGCFIPRYPLRHTPFTPITLSMARCTTCPCTSSIHRRSVLGLTACTSTILWKHFTVTRPVQTPYLRQPCFLSPRLDGVLPYRVPSDNLQLRRPSERPSNCLLFTLASKNLHRSHQYLPRTVRWYLQPRLSVNAVPSHLRRLVLPTRLPFPWQPWAHPQLFYTVKYMHSSSLLFKSHLQPRPKTSAFTLTISTPLDSSTTPSTHLLFPTRGLLSPPARCIAGYVISCSNIPPTRFKLHIHKHIHPRQPFLLARMLPQTHSQRLLNIRPTHSLKYLYRPSS